MQTARDGRKFAASLHIIVANNNINEATIIGRNRKSWPIMGVLDICTHIEPCSRRSI